MRAFIFSFGFIALSACTFVKMGPGGNAIKVAAIGKDLSACEKRGDIAVSVKDRLGPYERNTARVKDELEVLARNEAPGLKADTVQALFEPEDGSQKWRAYRCSGATIDKNTADEKTPDKATTKPLED
jgi:Domain of unknown function (DUF4156)